MPIGVAEFVENQENRCPVVLLLDTSGSMQGEPIKALNDGIKTFQEDVMRDIQGWVEKRNPTHTKSVEYRLLMRTGTHARGNHAKGGINNQFLITGFRMSNQTL